MSARPALQASMAQTFGLELARVGISREVALSNFLAGERHLRVSWPKLNLNDLVVGRHHAIDLVVDAARNPEARPIRALRAAANLAERALTSAETEDDHLSAWRQMSELLDRALAGCSS